MDIVYPLGTGSLCKNQELRYSLRSLQFIEHKKIFIVGHRPGFLKNIIHIKFHERTYKKQYNVISKLLEVCKHGKLSDDFLLMNDDFFFMKETEIKKYLYDCSIKSLQNKTPRTQYGKALANTIDYLNNNHLPFNNFEIHYPMIFNKQKFLELFSGLDLNKQVNYRSIYGNYYRLDNYSPHRDFKIHSIDSFDENQDHEFISIADKIMVYDRFKNFLKKKLPEKSIYEL
jgi:hypothetical protein